MAKKPTQKRSTSSRGGSRGSGGGRSAAEALASKQRDISVSEFFAKNRHLLGFDNPRKALLTTVKEAVDNALDACEEAAILPDITVQIEELQAPASASKAGRYRVTVTDNGPGVVRRQIENIFGKLLYGSKFHRLKMSRGQQGIGISAAGMYGLMTTGRPMVITTKPGKRKAAHHLELAMDTTRNHPEVTMDVETDEFPKTTSGTGTRVAIELEARYMKGKTSVDAYLEQTAIANPHAEITFIPPEKSAGVEEPEDEQAELIDGEDRAEAGEEAEAAVATLERTTELNDRIVFPRTVEELPPDTAEIKPHPYGVELGTFLRMLKSTKEKQLGGFFKKEFCRITPTVASGVYKAAGVTGQTWLTRVDHKTAEKLYKALQDAKLRAPPTDCLAPIGVRQMLAGLLKGVEAEFFAAATRAPAVYRGMPFQIEAAVAFGGDLSGEESARVIRFANRVPLLYQPSACSAFKSVVETGWRKYGLSQPRGAMPVGPLVVMIHMASVWVPFTSESKEAIADYDEIRKEMRLALQECGRKLGIYLRRRQKMKREGQRRDVFERYIGEIARSCEAITGSDAAEVYEALLRQARRRTEIADRELDQEGQFVKEGNGRLDDDEGVVILDRGGDDPDPPSDAPAGGTSQVEPKSKGRKRKAPASAAKYSKESDKKSGKKGAARKPKKGSAAKSRASKPRVQIQLTQAGASDQGGLFEGAA